MNEINCSDISLGGIVRDCSGIVGGVSRIAIATIHSLSSITIGEDGIVTAILPKDAITKPFMPYWQKKAVAGFTHTYQPSDTASGLEQNDLNFQIQKMSAKHRAEYLKLVSAEVIVLFCDNNGTWWLLGTLELPAEATAGDGSTGVALTDYNGYNVTISTLSRTTPPEVDPLIIEALIADLTV